MNLESFTASCLVAIRLSLGQTGKETTPTALLIALPVGIAVFYLTVIRPASRDRRRHQGLIQSLKKHDRVITAGGIIGLFVSTSQDGREVTLQVDDSLRLKFHRNYIVGILNDEKKDSK